DQRLRCASSLKSNTTLPRCASSRVARNFLVAPAISGVGLRDATFPWPKMFNADQEPNKDKAEARKIPLFMHALYRANASRSSRTHLSSPRIVLPFCIGPLRRIGRYVKTCHASKTHVMKVANFARL